MSLFSRVVTVLSIYFCNLEYSVRENVSGYREEEWRVRKTGGGDEGQGWKEERVGLKVFANSFIPVSSGLKDCCFFHNQLPDPILS